MARSPNGKVETARQLYNDGMKLVDIATKLNVPAGTVRRWKSTYHWDGERENERSKKSERSENKKSVPEKSLPDEVEHVLNNPDLNDRQRLFCIYYIRCFNATKAYQKAYGAEYTTAMVNGSQLLRKPKIKEEILRLKQDRLNREFLSESDIFQKYMDIAFADINDYVEVNNGLVMMKPEFDGTIVGELSNTQSGGIKFKLADRMKAMQWLGDHMNLATEKQKAEIALLKAKVQTNDGEEIADDGFLEALNGSAADDWGDGNDEEGTDI